jgi:hypothetical protein
MFGADSNRGEKMAAKEREALELALGVIIIQSALCDFMIESGTINLDSLIEHLHARRAAWKSAASEATLFPVDILLSMLEGQKLSALWGPVN